MKKQPIVRKCNYPDNIMLLAAAALTRNAKTYQAQLVTERPLWTPAYFTDLEGRIDTVVRDWLGYESTTDLDAATNKVFEQRHMAYQKLKLLRSEIVAILTRIVPPVMKYWTNWVLSATTKILPAANLPTWALTYWCILKPMSRRKYVPK